MRSGDRDRAQEDYGTWLARQADLDALELSQRELEDEADRVAAHGGLPLADHRCYELARRRIEARCS